MHTTLYRRALLGFAAVTLTVAACGNDATSPSTRFPAGVAAFSGDAQVDAPGATLSDPLVVKVFDDQGQPFAGVAVTWTLVSGGGTLSDMTTTTDASGEASVVLTLGPSLGDNIVTASFASLQTITFTATAELATSATP